jgi:hypothetical protein
MGAIGIQGLPITLGLLCVVLAVLALARR